MVAYYSVLVFNILDVTSFEAGAPPALGTDAPELLRNLADVLNGISAKNLQECFNDAVFYRDEIREL